MLRGLVREVLTAECSPAAVRAQFETPDGYSAALWGHLSETGLLGLTIASYSVADGLGVRFSQSPTGYMGWLFLFEAPVVLAVLGPRIVRRHHIDLKVFGIGLIGGALSVAAYGIALYAKTIAPIGAVSAVRESSVIIAALIGLFIFGERPWLGRILSAAVVAAGVVALAFAG